MASRPYATLADLETLLLVERGQVVSRGSIQRVLHEQGWRRKKACTPLSAYIDAIAQRTDMTRSHFPDETSLRI